MISGISNDPRRIHYQMVPGFFGAKCCICCICVLQTLVNACSPYFNELHWYVLEGYVHAVLGIGHRIRSEEEMSLEKEEEDAAELKQGLSNEDAEEMDQKKRGLSGPLVSIE